jgi:DNA invertase Pin-like site-specific DNA recombinase
MTKGKRIGYIRVSSQDQNTERQLDGIELDKVFTDKCSGKDTKRPQLQVMLDYIRDGDTLVVHSMDRLARNVVDLLQMVERLTKDGVTVSFVKENLTFSGEANPMNELLLIRERQREGIAIAKAKGKYKGRKPTLSDDEVTWLRTRAADPAISKAALAREMGISRMTLYRYLDGPA